MAKKRLLKIAELFDLSSAIKKQLNDDYAYENMTIEIILTDKELRMLDEELFLEIIQQLKNQNLYMLI